MALVTIEPKSIPPPVAASERADSAQLTPAPGRLGRLAFQLLASNDDLVLRSAPPRAQVRVHTVYEERPSEWTEWTAFGNVTVGIRGSIVVRRQDGNYSQIYEDAQVGVVYTLNVTLVAQSAARRAYYIKQVGRALYKTTNSPNRRLIPAPPLAQRSCRHRQAHRR